MGVSSAHLVVGIRGKNRSARQKFSENAARRPDVRLRFIATLSQQELWRTVPERHDFGRVSVFVAIFQLASQAEIGKLDFMLVCYKKIRCLQVSVHNPIFVKIIQRTEKLKHVPLHMVLRVSSNEQTMQGLHRKLLVSCILKNAPHVMFYVFHNHAYRFQLSILQG